MERRMSDKLDFSGFDTPAVTVPVSVPPKQHPKVAAKKTPKARKPGKAAPSRRKLRVNVSIEPGLSRRAAEEAERRGLTLSDLLRSAYRDNESRIDASWFGPNPAPFSHRSAASTGRIVHMLYLTDEEVAILAGLASDYDSSRSGVVAVLFRRFCQ
jgi:hypothetical protein